MTGLTDFLALGLFIVGPIVLLFWAYSHADFKKQPDPAKAFGATILIGFVSLVMALFAFNAPFFLLISCLGLGIITIVLFKTLRLFFSPQGKLPRTMLSCHLLLLVAIMVGTIWLWRGAWAEVEREGQRAKVARAKSEIRNLAVALETYYIKNESYPPAVDREGKIVPFSENGCDLSSGYVPWLLTTPVAHNPSIPDDPFGPKGKDIPYWTKTYRYAAKAKEYWIMTSAGPDRDQDMILEDYIRSASGDISLYLTQFGVGVAVEYDPTNGIGSSGDVFRTGP